jgi:uncharacterized repeat protein (TIGR03803 family)
MSGKSLLGAVIALASIIPFTGHAAVTETVLFRFDRANGATPEGLTADKSGAFYGVTTSGGEFGFGTVYKFDKGSLTVLHSFAGHKDGAYPNAGVTLKKGRVFGTTYGSEVESDYGTIYKIVLNGNEREIHVFKKKPPDGNYPRSKLVLGPDGAYYGTTVVGGSFGAGTVFRISSNGDDFSIIYSFTGGSDGANPFAGLLSDGAGTFYGTTFLGGKRGVGGTVFSVTRNGREHVIYSFIPGPGGYQPTTGVIADAAGNLYGTTSAGGSATVGVVFKISPDGTETLLHSFTGGDGAAPYGDLLMDKQGNIYGTTTAGGAEEVGTVFEITAAGKFNTLYEFRGLVDEGDGIAPTGDLYMDKQGSIYGTTRFGGSDNSGTIYKLTLQ